MLKILERIESISACRDRDLLAVTVTAALHEFFSPQSIALYRLVQKEGGVFLEMLASHDGSDVVFAPDGEGEQLIPIESQPLVADCLREGDPTMREDASGVTYVFPLNLQNATAPYGFFVFDFTADPSQEAREALGWILRFYTNYLSLLDYSELDTLTGLLNRKTFDEIFERILSRLPSDDGWRKTAEERRREPEGGSHWLAIIDLDHFKKINDNFGHLFGDEVLLRLGKLMRSTFRKHDLLFRFGGEEFVVVLRPNQQANALRAFDRFREKVESHEFPQVGKVTCSIGFTRVPSNMAPIDIVGRADRALYYAKENGRNRVCGFDLLVEEGKLAEQQGGGAELDIDALFG